MSYPPRRGPMAGRGSLSRQVNANIHLLSKSTSTPDSGAGAFYMSPQILGLPKGKK